MTFFANYDQLQFDCLRCKSTDFLELILIPGNSAFCDEQHILRNYSSSKDEMAPVSSPQLWTWKVHCKIHPLSIFPKRHFIFSCSEEQYRRRGDIIRFQQIDFLTSQGLQSIAFGGCKTQNSIFALYHTVMQLKCMEKGSFTVSVCHCTVLFASRHCLDHTRQRCKTQVRLHLLHSYCPHGTTRYFRI